MRPSILNPLFSSLDTLNGIGSRFETLLKNLCGSKVVDLLWHLPSGIIDRRCNIPLRAAQNGQLWTGKVRVVEHMPPHTRKQPYRIIVEDNSEQLILIFFKTFGDNLTKQFPVGSEKIISGKIEIFNRSLQMAHPDYIVDAAFPERMPLIETVYPLTAGITNKMLNKQISQALQNVPELPEWLDERLMKQENFSSFKQSLWQAHHPQKYDDLSPNSSARRRLAYDELLANQLSLAIVRQRLKKQKGRSLSAKGDLKQKLLKNLPFELTSAQKRAIAEIENDMQSDYRMLRLLQGDVGSGKTIVALITMLNAVECGCQAAIMAPTEILAQQHHEN